MPDSNRKKLQMSSWFAVVRAYQECTRRYSQMLAAFELTVPQFDVISAIATLGENATPKSIAEQLLVTRGNITGVLHRLQDRALITTKRHDSDGRSFVCCLTEDGVRLLAQARRAASLFIEQQLAPFDDAQLQETERSMTKMYRHLQTIDSVAIAAETLRYPAKPARRSSAR